MKLFAFSLFAAASLSATSASLVSDEAPKLSIEQGETADIEERKLSDPYYGGSYYGGSYYGGYGGGYGGVGYGGYGGGYGYPFGGYGYPYGGGWNPYFNYGGFYPPYYYPYQYGGPFSPHGPIMPPMPPGPDVPIAVPGRPFRTEIDGPALSAQVAVGMEGESARIWSRIPQDPRLLNEKTRKPNQEAVSEWATRASGEHASIASFAVFTLQLMTNAAPPHLIREALMAAMDELSHAETSFSMAALFAADPQAVVEPSGLPAVDNLKLEKNLKALAIGVAKEGCIDESLSALELASDARTLLATEGDKDTVNEISGRATWKIAIDESRHSMLSWRTLEWICHEDPSVCQEIAETILNTENMLEAYERRFPGREDMKEAWKEMSDALTKAILSKNVEAEAFDCNTPPEQVLKVENGADALAGHITRSIVCPMIRMPEGVTATN